MRRSSSKVRQSTEVVVDHDDKLENVHTRAEKGIDSTELVRRSSSMVRQGTDVAAARDDDVETVHEHKERSMHESGSFLTREKNHIADDKRDNFATEGTARISREDMEEFARVSREETDRRDVAVRGETASDGSGDVLRERMRALLGGRVCDEGYADSERLEGSDGEDGGEQVGLLC